MPKHIGVVIFRDGERRFFIYNGTVEIAFPELFTTRPLAEAAWEAYDDGRYDPFAVDRDNNSDSEPVALYSWDDHPDAGREPDFFTTASRLANVITGPINSDNLEDMDTAPHGPRIRLSPAGDVVSGDMRLQALQKFGRIPRTESFTVDGAADQAAARTIITAFIDRHFAAATVPAVNRSGNLSS